MVPHSLTPPRQLSEKQAASKIMHHEEDMYKVTLLTVNHIAKTHKLTHHWVHAQRTGILACVALSPHLYMLTYKQVQFCLIFW